MLFVEKRRRQTYTRTNERHDIGPAQLYYCIFPLPVIGLSICDRPPPCAIDIFHPFHIYIYMYTLTMRIDVKANTTIAVRRSESNDIPGGDLGKMIDGTCGSRSLLHSVIYIYIYITTIVWAPDVINNDFACLPPSRCFLFFRLMDVKSTDLRKRWAVTFRYLQYTLYRIVEIMIHLSFVVCTQYARNTVHSE